ncbi:MAG: hypothetical protein KC493_16190, partial [Bacteriovoracaceae bacterium]|nr:hypothetical protein [Bacteriovoracaceae bacterium]
MKYLVLLCIFFCLGAFAEGDAIPGDGTQPDDSGSYGQEHETENDMFGKLRDHNLVKKHYDSCMSRFKKDPKDFANTYAKDAVKPETDFEKSSAGGLGLGDCIWSQLDDSEKETVQEMVEYMEKDENGQNRQPAANEENNNKEYEGVSLISSKSIKLDPVDQKVQDFFAKKLVDGLYGTDKDKSQMVKHDNFYTL